VAHQYVRSPMVEHRFKMSLAAAAENGEEYRLPARAEVWELGPDLRPMMIVRLATSLRYIPDVSGEPLPIKMKNVYPIIFLEKKDGTWMPGLLMDEGKAVPTLVQSLREERAIRKEHEKQAPRASRKWFWQRKV